MLVVLHLRHTNGGYRQCKCSWARATICPNISYYNFVMGGLCAKSIPSNPHARGLIWIYAVLMVLWNLRKDMSKADKIDLPKEIQTLSNSSCADGRPNDIFSSCYCCRCMACLRQCNLGYGTDVSIRSHLCKWIPMCPNRTMIPLYNVSFVVFLQIWWQNLAYVCRFVFPRYFQNMDWRPSSPVS